MKPETSISNSRILVTGGAGFIGSNICEALLKQDNEVICLDNFITGKKENLTGFTDHPGFTLIEGDIRDISCCKKAVDGADYVLHQAALGSVPRSINDPLTTNEVNITGFLNMLSASKEAKVKRFVYAASSSTYGDSAELPKVEERIGKPLSPYAVTKYVNELYANVFASLYGIEVIGLRYFNVFGKHQNPEGAYAAAIPKFIRSFVNMESPVIHGNGLQTRDFTYIENVVLANLIAMAIKNPDALNTVYNVAFGESIKVNELAVILRGLLGKFNPAINNVQIIYGPERIGDVKYSLASIEKAKKLLGYQPKFDVRAGLALAIEWYWKNLVQDAAGKV